MRLRLLLALPLLLLVACGSAALQTGPTVPTLVQVGGSERAITTITDADDVRDVAQGGGYVYVATDRGVLVYPASGDGAPVRVAKAQGLAGDDVRAVAVTPDGHALVATVSGMNGLVGSGTPSAQTAPPVGKVTDLAVDGSGKVWACGQDGVARLDEGGWQRFGEEAACTRLVTSPGGHLWVGTTRGLWYIDGDVIREHAPGQGIPESGVRDIVPMGHGKVMVLVEGPSAAELGYFDGKRWYGYTIDDLSRVPLGLTRHGTDVLLVTPGNTFAIARSTFGHGVPLTPLSRSPLHGVRSYRARMTAAADVAPPHEPTSEPLPSPLRLAQVPVDQPTIDAPSFVVRNTNLAAAKGAYLVRRDGGTSFIADRNRGVIEMSPSGATRLLRSKDLVAAQDLQVASDTHGRTWLLTDHGDVLREDGHGGYRRVATPDGFTPSAIASGPQGVYVIGRVGTEGTTVRVYRSNGEGWSKLLERLLTVPAFVSAPMMGVTENEVVWAGLRIKREGSDATRMRGVAILDPRNQTVVYHHRGASAPADGPGALSMPDTISAVDLNQPGMAWFGSLSGAVRVGNSQAVVFGEDRGVRGEVVSDVAVGTEGKVWVAAAEGVGYYLNGHFDFRMPQMVQQARPVALAVDAQGHVWGAGEHGVVYDSGRGWQKLDTTNGLPTNDLRDVEVDAAGRVWLLANDRVIIFTPVGHVAAGQTAGS